MPRYLEADLPAGLIIQNATILKGSTRIIAEAVGAGGGGTNTTSAQGGGGGGAYARTTALIGSNQTIYWKNGIGGGAGLSGESSSVSFSSDLSNPLVLAAPGGSSSTITGGAGGTVAASIGTVRFAGGNGGNGQSAGGPRAGGGGGAPGGPFGDGANGTAGSGNVPGNPGNQSGGPWSVSVASFTEQINEVYFLNNIHFILTESGIFTSTDSITWTRRLTSTSSVTQLIYTGVNYVVVGNGEIVYTSSNGTTWSTRTPNLALDRTFNCVAHNGSGFLIAGGIQGAIMTSSDHGVTWTQGVFPGYDTDSIAYLPATSSFYLTAGFGFSPSGLFTTQDGDTFFGPLDSPVTRTLNVIDSVLYGVSSSPTTRLFRSTNGADWSVAFDNLDSSNSIISNSIISYFKTPAGKFVIITSLSIYISLEGNSWYRTTYDTTFDIAGPAVSPTDIVAFTVLLDFFGGGGADSFRATLTKPTIDASDLNGKTNLAKINLIPGGRGGLSADFADDGNRIFSGHGAGGGGGGNNGGTPGLGSNGVVRIHYSPRRKMVS